MDIKSFILEYWQPILRRHREGLDEYIVDSLGYFPESSFVYPYGLQLFNETLPQLRRLSQADLKERARDILAGESRYKKLRQSRKMRANTTEENGKRLRDEKELRQAITKHFEIFTSTLFEAFKLAKISPEDFKSNEDYREISLRGRVFHLPKLAAKCVRVLHKKTKVGEPWMTAQELRDALNQPNSTSKPRHWFRQARDENRKLCPDAFDLVVAAEK